MNLIQATEFLQQNMINMQRSRWITSWLIAVCCVIVLVAIFRPAMITESSCRWFPLSGSEVARYEMEVEDVLREQGYVIVEQLSIDRSIDSIPKKTGFMETYFSAPTIKNGRSSLNMEVVVYKKDDLVEVWLHSRLKRPGNVSRKDVSDLYDTDRRVLEEMNEIYFKSRFGEAGSIE